MLTASKLYSSATPTMSIPAASRSWARAAAAWGSPVYGSGVESFILVPRADVLRRVPSWNRNVGERAPTCTRRSRTSGRPGDRAEHRPPEADTSTRPLGPCSRHGAGLVAGGRPRRTTQSRRHRRGTVWARMAPASTVPSGWDGQRPGRGRGAGCSCVCRARAPTPAGFPGGMPAGRQPLSWLFEGDGDEGSEFAEVPEGQGRVGVGPASGSDVHRQQAQPPVEGSSGLAIHTPEEVRTSG